jgi:hypothetical protein
MSGSLTLTTEGETISVYLNRLFTLNDDRLLNNHGLFYYRWRPLVEVGNDGSHRNYPGPER